MFFFFFFSSRRRHTRSLCDWSSDVCSSDLASGSTARPVGRGPRQLRKHEGSQGKKGTTSPIDRQPRPPKQRRRTSIVPPQPPCLAFSLSQFRALASPFVEAGEL